MVAVADEVADAVVADAVVVAAAEAARDRVSPGMAAVLECHQVPVEATGVRVVVQETVVALGVLVVVQMDRQSHSWTRRIGCMAVDQFLVSHTVRIGSHLRLSIQ